MKKFTYSIFGLLVCTYFMRCQTWTNQTTQTTQTTQQAELNQVTQSKITEIESYRGIKIHDEGPAGSKHINSKRGEFGCLKFRITIFNDTIVSIELEFKFPAEQVTSLPDSLIKVQGWVLPDSLTPDTFQRASNFGITGLEDHFNSDFTDSGIVKTTIQPKGHHSFYLAFVGESPFEFGTQYSKLFINGQEIDAPYLPVKSFEPEGADMSSLYLVWGIGHTPHNLYTLIPCGQINFLK